MDTRNGALITDIVENSSMDEGGLQKGDVLGCGQIFFIKNSDQD